MAATRYKQAVNKIYIQDKKYKYWFNEIDKLGKGFQKIQWIVAYICSIFIVDIY